MRIDLVGDAVGKVVNCHSLALMMANAKNVEGLDVISHTGDNSVECPLDVM